MKKTWILACFLALAAAAGFAQTPSDAPILLAAILEPSASSGACPLPENEVSFAATRSGLNKALCQASCGSGTYVSCSYTAPSTCTAVDRNCPSTQGYVTCNGVTTYCPTCGTTCTQGSFRYIPTGYCCPEGNREKEQQVCNNNVWYYTGVITCGGPCGPIIPEPF
jgi:hypothetical protein